MTALTLLLVSLCVLVHSAPLGELHRHRSDYGVYANNYARDYEPLVYAAIPLHAPVPVLHVLSRKPLPLPGPGRRYRDRGHAPSVNHPVYARPPYHDKDYAPSAHNDYEYTGYGYNDPQGYAEHYVTSVSDPEEQDTAPSGSATQDEITILYARPNSHGGFSYRRRPSKTAPKRTPVSTTESPVIIRVHKVKIIRDR